MSEDASNVVEIYHDERREYVAPVHWRSACAAVPASWLRTSRLISLAT